MNCCICSQIAGDPSNDLLARAVGASSYVRRIPIETENFAVIPSLGPLVPGHVILCPKYHYRSFTTVPPRHDNEFERLLMKLKDLLRTAYSVPIHLFEHGMAQDGSRVLCSVDHAHLHLVPTTVSVIPILRPYSTIRVPSGLSGLRSVAGQREYVFYEGPDGNRFVVPADNHQFQSQYLRRIFSEAIGKANEWNWREHMNPAEAAETYERLRTGAAEVFASSEMLTSNHH